MDMARRATGGDERGDERRARRAAAARFPPRRHGDADRVCGHARHRPARAQVQRRSHHRHARQPRRAGAVAECHESHDRLRRVPAEPAQDPGERRPRRRGLRRLRGARRRVHAGHRARHHPLSRHARAAFHARALPPAGPRRVVCGVAVRADQRAARVPVLRRAGLEDALAPDHRRARRRRGGEQHAGDQGRRRSGPRRLDAPRVCADEAAAGVSGGAGDRAIRGGRRRHRGREADEAPLPHAKGPRRGGALCETGDAAAARAARGVLRHAVSVREARLGEHPADHELRRDGERRHDHLRLLHPARHGARGDHAVQAALRRDRRARDRAHVVRQPGDARLVERHLAERGLCQLDGAEDAGGAESRMGRGLDRGPRAQVRARHRPPGVRAFLKRHAYSTATAEDFIRALGEAAGRGPEALAVFRGFIEQPGVPLLDIALDCAKDPAVEVRQQRLRPVGSRAPELQWTTPACFRDGSRTQCADIGASPQRVPLSGPACPAALVANVAGRSYYVPRYAPPLAQQLRLRSAELTADEMVATTVDAGVLAESGLMSIGEALAWADAGLTHPSPLARRFAADLVHEQRDAWLSASETVVKSTILAQRLLPLARELGWSERAGDSDDVRDLRATLLPYAAEAGDAALQAQARELALAWIDKRDAVPATLTRAVLDTAGRFADAELYGRLRGLATSTLDLRERYYLLAALGKVRDGALRERALGLTLEKETNGRDARELIEDALEDEFNRRAAFDFVRANYDALEAKLPEYTMARRLNSSSSASSISSRASRPLVSFSRVKPSARSRSAPSRTLPSAASR